MSAAKDKKMARQSLHEELTAIRAYTTRAKRASCPGLKKAFHHALGEEKTHAKMFRAELRH